MNVVILQPSYVPWRGYFHQVQKADIFVFYDCVQYDKRGWRNRNIIKTAQGPKWITIPVQSKSAISAGLQIRDILIDSNDSWKRKHLSALRNNYGKAPYFRRYESLIEDLFSQTTSKLADFTCRSTEILARGLGVENTEFLRSSDLSVDGVRTDRLINILKHVGATHYISGPSARTYIEENKFDEAGISIEYMVYDYPEYEQLHGEFLPGVSILDLLFNVGPKAANYIWEK